MVDDWQHGHGYASSAITGIILWVLKWTGAQDDAIDQLTSNLKKTNDQLDETKKTLTKAVEHHPHSCHRNLQSVFAQYSCIAVVNGMRLTWITGKESRRVFIAAG